MKTRALTESGDWTFGKGKANYKAKSEAIRQNVVSRIRSFSNDWFPDIGNGIPWIELLGTKGNEKRIISEIEAVVLATNGIRTIEKLEVTGIDGDRGALINLVFKDIFDQRYDEQVSIK